MPLFQVPSSSVVDVFPGVNDSAKGDTQHKDQSMFFQSCLEEDPLFAHQVQSLERMLRVRDRLASGALHSGCGNGGGTCAAGTSAVEHDSHDVVSECGSGPSVRQPRVAHPTAGLALHDLESSEHVSNGALVRSALAGRALQDLEGSLLESNSVQVQRDCVSRLQLQDGLDDCRFRRVSTAGVDLEHATAGDGKGIIGLLERSVSQSSCLNSDNSSMGVACVESALPAVAPFCFCFLISLYICCSCCCCCARATVAQDSPQCFGTTDTQPITQR